MRRRDWLKGLALGGIAAALLPGRFASAEPALDDVEARLAALERKRGGRLGVAILDTGSGRSAAHRADERFQMCSTFKWLLAAAVLKRVDGGTEKLDRRIVFDKDALLDWAPVTSKHVGTPGMTVGELCEAAVTLSDNTAANMLLHSVGGPPAVTGYVRGLGDPVTRLDRMEPTLNQPHGDLDTTTPKAMLADLQRVLLGDVLTQPSRERLVRWMLACQTGLQSLRAGFPTAWRAGDKTGQWDGHGIGINNDVAIAWPPGRKPLLVAAYYATPSIDVAARKAVLAEVGRIAANL